MTSPDLVHASRPPAVRSLSRYGRALTRYAPLVVVLGVLGAVLAGFTSPLRHPTYTSTAVVEVRPLLQSLSSPVAGAVPAPNLVTEQNVVLSTAVVDATLKQWKSGLSADDFLAVAAVTSVDKSTTLSLALSGRTPQEGQQGAQAWADVYLGLRRQQGTTQLDAALKRVSDSTGVLQSQLTLAQGVAAAAASGTPAALRADTQVRLVNDQLTPVRARLDALSSMTVDAGQLVSAPVLATDPDGLPSLLVRGVGAIIGLLAGAALALLAEHVWGRVRGARDARAAVAVPVWAAPKARKGDESSARRDPSIAILVGLLDNMSTKRDQTVVITDCFGELATGFVAQLAEAREEQRVPGGVPHHGEGALLAVPGLLRDPEALSWAVGADLVLLLIEDRRTQRRHLRAAVSVLEEAGSRLDGVILVNSTLLVRQESLAQAPDEQVSSWANSSPSMQDQP